MGGLYFNGSDCFTYIDKGAIDLKGQIMIQDRLTAKFLTAPRIKKTEVRPLKVVTTKRKVAPATDLYTRGRSLFGTFWL